MWLYYALIFYILIGAIIIYLNGTSKNRDKLYTFLIMGILLFMSAFRSINVGNDTDEYIAIFNEVKLNGIGNLLDRYEIGYLLLNQLASTIFKSPQSIIIITSIYIFYGYSKFIYENSNNKWLSIYIFFMLPYFSFSMSGIRQAIAIVILFNAYKYLKLQRKLSFLISVILAATFHNTAIIFILAYPDTMSRN